MAKIGLFIVEETPLFKAAEAGVWSHGHTSCAYLPGAWIPRQANRRDFDGAVIYGLRGTAAIAEWYSSRGIPVSMLDFPHLRGYSQVRVGPPDGAWLPESRPSDRLDDLGIEYGTRGDSDAVCILGQLGPDASHGLTTGGLKEWSEGVVKRLRSVTTAKLIWRPHPLDRSRWAPGGVDEVVGADESLAETFAKCGRVVTYCSGGGLEALIAGLPVVAEGSCVYSSLSGTIKAWSSTGEPPKRAELDAVLSRVAYTQWSHDEIASGAAFAQIGGELFSGLEFDKPEPATVALPSPAAESIEPASPASLDERQIDHFAEQKDGAEILSLPPDSPTAFTGQPAAADGSQTLHDSVIEAALFGSPKDPAPSPEDPPPDPPAETVKCPHCGKEYSSRNHWFQTHVDSCEGS